MSQPVSRSDADRNLLFGILAVQVNLIDRDALVAAMQAWVLNKQKSLGQILLEQHNLTTEQVGAIDTLIEQHLKRSGDHAELSLQATKSWSGTPQDLLLIDDDELRSTVGKLGWTGRGAETTNDPASVSRPRFHKLREHAKGGLGKVFVATDTELNREVALKEMRLEYADDGEQRRRFVLEAEITGGLEHPGIVPVYGLGAHSDGRPFYAMRFIRGEDLRHASQQFHAAEKPGRDPGERSLAFRQLLSRFVAVCNAVAYAHNRGVIHRDLKPANVMLGKFGETLVVDWGLAKTGIKFGDNARVPITPLSEGTLRPVSGSSVETTMEGARIGTPPFMSPEQAAGRIVELDAASDIYSLGSTLYMLLTGRVPYEAPTRPEVLAKVERGVFSPPQEVKPQTPAALDAICRKAMSLHPPDRYASAMELAADVEHWLADEPVAAYPEPWTARTGRWARRHRAVVAATIAILTCAVVALSITTALVSAEQHRTERQREIAVSNYQISREQSFNIIKLIESSEPEFARIPVLHERRAELLQTASSACRKFLEQDPDNLELIERAANIYRYTANFRRLTYEHEQAVALYNDALSLRKRLVEEFPEPVRQVALAEIHRDLAASQTDQGHLKAAAENVGQGLALTETLRKGKPENPAYRRGLALLLLRLDYLEGRQQEGRLSESSQSPLTRSIDLLRGLVNGPTLERHAYDPLLLAAALNQQAIRERQAGSLEVAQKTHAETVKLLISLRDAKLKEVNEADVVYLLADCQLEQCQTWAKIDKPNYLSNAEKNAGLAINKLFELARDYPKLPTYQETLAKAYCVRGELRLQGKNFPGAREHFQSAKELLVALVKKHDAVPSVRGELGRTYVGLATVAMHIKDDDQANWFDLAKDELQAGVRLSPDDVHRRRALDDLTKARSATTVP